MKMRNKIIKPYDETDSFYSGSDEEYEEFLKTIDGKINVGEPVEDKQMDDLGETKTINLQGVIDKFRKTAEGIKDVSKKITSEAVNKIEDMKKTTDDFEHGDLVLDKDKENDDEIILDVDEIKKQISDAVSKSMMNFNTKTPENCDQKIEEMTAEIRKLNDLIKDVEINVRDNSSSSESVRLKTETISSGVEEIRQAVSSISKLNDSIFDLKNAQLNAKNSLENLESNFNNLKKKCVLGITIISILTLISIGMSILVLLS